MCIRDRYYFGRNKIDYNWLVVTAACMLVNAAKFNKVNGFNEDMPVAYNDVEPVSYTHLDVYKRQVCGIFYYI